MWFKHARLYAITEALENDHGQIEQALSAFKFTPCTSQEALKLGFCFAMHPGTKQYCHQVNDLMVFSIRKQEKLLPSSVVNEELAPKVEAMEQEKGRPLSRKEKQALKEELIQTLLPRAFSKSTVTTAYYDRSTSMLIVDTASASTAEEFLALLRKSFGSLPAMPLLDNHQLNQQMHFWLQGKDLPAGITLGSSAVLKAPDEEGAQAKFINHLLSADEVQSHLQDKLVSRLQLEQDEKISFTVRDDGCFTGIKFHDLLCNENEEQGWDDTIGRLDADFILMSGQFKQTLTSLLANLKSVDTPRTAEKPRTKLSDADPLFNEAKAFVIECQKASVSGIQRKFRIGYNRAAHLMEDLQFCGVVSAMSSDGNRTVLMKGA